MSVADASPAWSPKVSSHSRRPGRSSSNRFSSFLRPKSSYTNNFSIDLDHPIKTYGPGAVVSGKVVLDVARPLGVTHLVVGLHGYVQVFKNHAKSKAVHPNSSGRAVTGRGKRWVSEYYGDGYMSLFEEEMVLCGEGRLDPASSPFHFHFNLDFPSELALPSSIDFERGTIAYVVTATMTRPAYTAPTMSCDTRVAFLEDIDVAVLSIPKPREVNLAPEHRSGSPRSSLKKLTAYDAKRTHRNSSVSTSVPSNKSTIELASSNAETISVRAPSASIASTRSSSSGRNNRASIAPSEPRSSYTSPSLNGEPHRPVRTIVASAELCKGGCLPGQSVPLLVKISHNKVVHNPAGILVTLYRQARVDMHPHLPLASSEKGTNARYEDYYPRSKTGLGGLSLSAAGSSQVWRKDLSQTTAPLYINPQTMAQEIKLGVRVPDLPGVFPSIRNVPGQMISFRYVVEVIIDIHGKLIGRDRAHSGSNMTAGSQQSYDLNGPLLTTDLGDRTQATMYESRCMDTTQLRRDKYAVTMECELIVGTRDSQSTKGKRKELIQDAEISSGVQPSNGDVAASPSGRNAMQEQNHDQQENNQSAPDEGYQWLWRWDEYGQRWFFIDDWGNVYDEGLNFLGYDYDHDYALETEQDQRIDGDPAVQIAPPEFADEGDVSEKERLRRAEQSLLPSQPPMDGPAASQAVDFIPTAPSLPEESFLYSLESPPTALGFQQSSSGVQESGCGHATQVRALATSPHGEGSSFGATAAEMNPDLPLTEDTDEQERPRLQALASRPESVATQEAAGFQASMPSAEEGEARTTTGPVSPDGERDDLAGEDLAEAGREETLPRYQR